jgi:hypothetical protein
MSSWASLAFEAAEIGVFVFGMLSLFRGKLFEPFDDITWRQQSENAAFHARSQVEEPAEEPAGPASPEQPFDAFLVLDVEGTCVDGTGFGWPNEIIEFPVCLLRWTDKKEDGTATKLVVVDEFRSFVRPTWRPQLDDFCTTLTGISQVWYPTLDVFLGRSVNHGHMS